MRRTILRPFRILHSSTIIIAVLLCLAVEAKAASVSVSPTTVTEGGSTTAIWSGFSGNVNVWVYKGSTRWTDANTNVPGSSGSQVLNTSGWEPRTDYRVGIELRSTPFSITYSNYFTVNAKTGTVSVSPSTVTEGNSTTASWSGFGANVNVWVYKGSTRWTDANTNVPGSNGSQVLDTTGWEPRTDYRVGIELRSTPFSITYSNYFTVNAKTGTVSVSPSTVTEGNSTTASWSGFGANVNVLVYKGSTRWTDANTNVPGSSGAQVLNTSGWEPRTDYRVGIELRSTPFSITYSNYFTVLPAKLLDITHPNGGETLFKGTEYTITWTSSSSVVGFVRIDLYKGSGTTPALSLAANDPNDGNYPFNPPPSLIDGSDYKICMSAEGGTVSNCGGFFTINTPSGPNLTSPANNATISNSNIVFTWSSVANAASYEILVDNNSGFGSPELNETINAPTTTRTVVNHLPDNLYYWKVRAQLTNATYSAWSNPNQFTYHLPVSSNPVWVPLYRLYNATSKDHFYTTSPSQRDSAKAYGYVFEKIEAYISDRKFNDANAGYLFRLYNPTSNVNFYTSSEVEKDARIIGGYAYEGIAGFIYTSATEGMAPLYYLEKGANTDNFYTISKFERDNAISAYGFTDQGVQCYVSPSTVANNRPQGYFAGIGMFNGAFSVPFTDISLKGEGPALTLTRYYNSYNDYELPFGSGWSHSLYNYAIEHPNGAVSDVTIKWGNGTEDFFKNDGANNFSGILGSISKLIKVNDDLYELTSKDQTVYTFARVTVNTTMGASFIPDLPLIRIQNKFNNQVVLSPNAVNGRIDRAYRMLNGAATDQSLTFNYTDIDVNGRVINLLTSIVDTSITPNRTIIYGYNANGYLSSVTDARNNTTSYTYNTEGFLTGITYPEGNAVAVVYDALQRATSFTAGSISLSFDYNTTTGTTVKNGTTTLVNYVHDPQYRAEKVTFAENVNDSVQPTYCSGNNLNLPCTIKDRNGNSSSYTYDSNGNLLTSKNDTLNLTTTYTYDAKNNLTSVKDPRNNTTVFNYDTAGKTLTSVQKPLGGTTYYTYYPNGQVNTVTDPTTHSVTYSYDANGNVAKINDNALSTSIDFTNDGAGRRLTRNDQLRPTPQLTTWGYDNNDNVTSVKVANHPSAIFNYDRNNRIKNVVDQRTKTTTYTYNSMNLVASQTSPDQKSWLYNYNNLGNLSALTLPDGNGIAYTYDANNRLQFVRYNGLEKLEYAYDNNGNVLTIQADDSRTTSFAYDAANRVTSITDPFNNVIGYGYDLSGNRNTISYPGNKVVNYTFDADNRLATVKDWLGSAVTSYGYNTAGILQSITNANGSKAYFGHDPANRLISLINIKANNSDIASYSLILDNVGNPTSIVRIEHLVPPIPAAVDISYSYSSANQIENAGNVTYTHDGLGNLSGSNYGSSFAFDYANRMLSATIGSDTFSYLYDGMGNRVSRTKSGAQPEQTKYILDLNAEMSNVLAETNAAGDIQNYYIHGFGLISRINAGGQRNTYHYDTLGNTVAVTDESNNVVESYTYDEFGAVIAASPANTLNPFRYVGKYGVMDEGNGLLYMRARFYDTGTGRFISRDPLGFGSGDLNLYRYAADNPVAGVDPSGLDTYLMRRNIEGEPGGIITHSFIYTTNDDGTLEHTYGWGSIQKKNEKGETIGIWDKDNRFDVKAAQRDIVARTLGYNHFVKGKHIGDSAVDQKIEDNFNRLKLLEEDPQLAQTFNPLLFSGGQSCKLRAYILYYLATGKYFPFWYQWF